MIAAVVQEQRTRRTYSHPVGDVFCQAEGMISCGAMNRGRLTRFFYIYD